MTLWSNSISACCDRRRCCSLVLHTNGEYAFVKEIQNNENDFHKHINYPTLFNDIDKIKSLVSFHKANIYGVSCTRYFLNHCKFNPIFHWIMFNNILSDDTQLQQPA